MKMKFNFLLVFLTLTTAAYALDRSDKVAIDAIIERMSETWNHQAGNGFADSYAQNASFVNIFGMAFFGKEEIEKRHVAVLDSFLKGSKFQVDALSLREVQPGIAIVLMDWTVTHVPTEDNFHLGSTLQGVYTHVFVNHNGKWEITASQNTLKK